MATKITEPTMDQTMGKGWPSILSASSVGGLNCPTSQLPRRAPTKPTAEETKQPPHRIPDQHLCDRATDGPDHHQHQQAQQ